MDAQVQTVLSAVIVGLAGTSAVLALMALSFRRKMTIGRAQTGAILSAAVDGIITINEHGIVKGFNRAAERLFGYRADEVIGRNVSMLMPEPHRSKHDGYLKHYLKTGQARVIGIGREVEGQRKDGSTFPMDFSVGEALHNGTRTFTGIVRDITDRKRTESELRSAKEQAERAILSQSKFLAAASHDLRQPQLVGDDVRRL